MAQDQVGVKLTLDANDGLKSLKDLKNSIKEAKGDLIAMAEKFGETSTEARSAAKRVAELEDAIGDSKTLIDQFNPDKKFNAFAQSLNGVLGGFSALQGAMGLLGVESEDLQKQLLKVQSAMALSQGLNQVLESGNAIRNFGKTIVATLGKSGAIGLAIAGVAALGYAIWDAIKGTDEIKESIKEFAKGSAEATKEMRSLRNTIDQAKLGIVSKNEALKAYNETIGKVAGTTNDLNEAEMLMQENAGSYIKVQGLKAQANYLIQKSAEKAAEAQLLQATILDNFNNTSREEKFGALQILKQTQEELTSYDSAIEKINKKIADVKFKVTTSGLGSAFGGIKKGDLSDNKSAPDKQKEKEVKQEYDLGITKSEIRQNAQLTLMKNDDLFRQMLSDQQMKWDEEDLAQEQEMYYAQRQANEDYQNAIIANEEMAAQTRIQTATSVANAFGALSEVFGKQTAAGKALAIAQATINTWVGVTEVLRAKSVLPEPFGTISKIANVAAIVASGINAIKNISKTQVPGAAGGGSGSMSAPTLNSPLTPQIGVTNTQLNQQQLNQLGNATTRAYVVESDVSGNQERIRRLNRAARLG